MISARLLEIINESKKPETLLDKLHEAQFAVADTTEEGDSVLHLLVQSRHTEGCYFSDYVEQLMAAGANPNAIDKQHKNFLHYYVKHPTPYDRAKLFGLLLKHPYFNVNFVPENEQTFFEIIYNSGGYQRLELLRILFNHQHFNFNLKNKEGKTALGVFVSDTRYKDLAIIGELINKSDLGILDNEGNSYLQLAILSTKHQGDELITLLLQRNIDWAHKNNEGKAALDLIKENKIQRSTYSNIQLLSQLVTSRPAALFARYSDGTIVLSELLHSKDYSVRSRFSELFKSGNHPEYAKEFNELIMQCFSEYQRDELYEPIIIDITDALLSTGTPVDVEYCLACALSRNFSSVIDTIKKLKSPIDIEKTTHYIKSLTPEGSEARDKALDRIQEMSFHLDSFDSSILAWEEKRLRSKDIATDTNLFGHLFSLEGLVLVNDGQRTVDLTGSSSSKTIPFMVHLMNAYVSHCEENNKHTEHLDAIRQVRNMTVKAMRFYFLTKPWSNYSLKVASDVLLSAIEESKGSGVELMTGWSGHAVNLIIKQDNLYRNNGGGCSTDAATEHYKITKVEQLTKVAIEPLFNAKSSESNKKYIQQDLHEILGLNYVGSIPGAFQTVGNCSFHSLIIALKVKYRLFIADEQVADTLFADTVKFFEQLGLEEYLASYADQSVLPHLLTRLMIQKLMPGNQLELARDLLTTHFKSEISQDILRTDCMIKRWRLVVRGKSVDEFDKQLQALGVDITPMNARQQLLRRFLDDKVTQDDLDNIKSWPLNEQSFQGYHLLHIAVMNNNLALATSLIQLFPDSVNQSNWYEEEPLCLVKSVEMIELLVAKGAKLDRTEDDNPLDCAILDNSVDLVNALLQHGAKTSKYSAYYAATKDPKILKLLIKFHPQAISRQTHNYSISVHAAASAGHSDNLRTLVYYGGASPAASNVNGLTPLHLALKGEHDETAKLLIAYPGTLFKTPYRGDSLASMTRNSDLQEALRATELERKADLAAFEHFKKGEHHGIEEDIDYLLLAIRENNPSIVRGCLIAYPGINVVTNSKLYCNTPLTDAVSRLVGKKGVAYSNAFKIIEILLKTPGININACMATTEPLIFMATSIDNVEVLELFLADPNLDLNQQDNGGYTALHDAVERGNWNCVKRLLQDERLDSTVRTKQENKTAAELKGKYDFERCIDKVRQHQQDLENKRISPKS